MKQATRFGAADGGGILGAFGKIWTAPVSILAALAGVATLPFGTHIGIGNNAIQFTNFPIGKPGEAATFGNVQFYPRQSNPATTLGFYYGSPVPINLGLHEQGHTVQYQALGIFFLPAYFASGGISAGNPFEQAANRFALGGSALSF